MYRLTQVKLLPKAQPKTSEPRTPQPRAAQPRAAQPRARQPSRAAEPLFMVSEGGKKIYTLSDLLPLSYVRIEGVADPIPIPARAKAILADLYGNWTQVVAGKHGIVTAPAPTPAHAPSRRAGRPVQGAVAWPVARVVERAAARPTGVERQQAEQLAVFPAQRTSQPATQ